MSDSEDIGPSVELRPTYHGLVQSTLDALYVIEGCVRGKLSHVPRRPHEKERQFLIHSGCVFVYEENASGIKRWTDGMAWSPSRIQGNGLIYRQLDKPLTTGEKKRASKSTKRKRESDDEGENARIKSSVKVEYQQESDWSSPEQTMSPPTKSSESDPLASLDQAFVRRMLGSLVDSYGFKVPGLIKKTMTVRYKGVTLHLVSYYDIFDVASGKLRRPCEDETASQFVPRADLISEQNFKFPLFEHENDPPWLQQHLHMSGSLGYIQSYTTTFPPTYHDSYQMQAVASVPRTMIDSYPPVYQSAYSASVSSPPSAPPSRSPGPAPQLQQSQLRPQIQTQQLHAQSHHQRHHHQHTPSPIQAHHQSMQSQKAAIMAQSQHVQMHSYAHLPQLYHPVPATQVPTSVSVSMAVMPHTLASPDYSFSNTNFSVMADPYGPPMDNLALGDGGIIHELSPSYSWM